MLECRNKFFEELSDIEIMREYDAKELLTFQIHGRYKKSDYREKAFAILQKTEDLKK